jgi:hypothetical protein
MKKRKTNHVGKLLLSHLRDHAAGLYDFLMTGAGLGGREVNQ